MDVRTEFATRRVILEPIHIRHASLVFRQLCAEDLYTFIPQDPPDTLACLEKRFSLLSVGASPSGDELWGNWAMRACDGSTYIGLLEATVRNRESAYLAYMVFEDFRRKGYAEEALRALIAWFTFNTEVHQFCAEVDTRNVPSQRLLEKLGFKRSVEIEKAAMFKGAWSNEYRYELAFAGSEQKWVASRLP